MKLVAAALAQPQSETVSLGSGNASGRERDSDFAQLLRGSLGKLQGNSSSPARATTQETRPEGTVTAVQLRSSEATESRAPAITVEDFGSNTPPRLPSRASRAPLATTTTTRPFANDTASNARPAPSPRTAAQPTAAAIPRAAGDLAGLRSLELEGTGAGIVITTSATLGGRLMVVEREASSPAPATISTAKADTASTADSLARAALATAPATTTATTTPDDSGAAHRFARIALASAPTSPFGDFGSDTTPCLPARASRAPLAPFGDFGSDTTPHLPAPASHAPLATTTATTASGSSAAQSSSQSTVDFLTATTTAGSNAVHAFARITPASVPATATATTTTGGSSAAQSSARTAAHSAATTTTAPAPATATVTAPAPAAAADADVAPLTAQAGQPAELARATHDDSAASNSAPPLVAGATSRPAKPASAAPQPAAPMTIVNAQPAADAKAPTGPAPQPWAETRDRISAAHSQERPRAQDSTDDSSPAPSPSLAIFGAAANPIAPAVHTHNLHASERTAVTENPHALPTSDSKQTADHAAPALSVPAQPTHQPGQSGLRAEAQVTTTLPQALPQVTLPFPTPATSTLAADLRAAAHLPAQAAPLAAQAARDDGLSMTVLPHAAHMAIESPAGDLDLHMRVRQGSAEITMGGSMAHLFDTRAPEARAALAGEGLALGRFDSGQQGGGQQNQPTPETPEAAGESPTAYRPHQTAPVPVAPGDGRIHVTA